MRALVASVLALVLVVASATAHVHEHATTTVGDECAICTLHHFAPPSTEAADLAPTVIVEADAPAAPGLPPVCGAPLGAIPGQSPPVPA